MFMIHEAVVVVVVSALRQQVCLLSHTAWELSKHTWWKCVCVYNHGQPYRCEVFLVNEIRMMKICSKEERSVEQSRFFALSTSRTLPFFYSRSLPLYFSSSAYLKCQASLAQLTDSTASANVSLNNFSFLRGRQNELPPLIRGCCSDSNCTR